MEEEPTIEEEACRAPKEDMVEGRKGGRKESLNEGGRIVNVGGLNGGGSVLWGEPLRGRKKRRKDTERGRVMVVMVGLLVLVVMVETQAVAVMAVMAVLAAVAASVESEA